jgi:DNA polymerase III subunit epsilon
MTTKNKLPDYNDLDLKKISDVLDNSNNYRVITRYEKPEFYNVNVDIPKNIGVFLDIEATGLSFIHDKFIELGMVKFEYSDDGRIFRIIDQFNEYQDPCIPISAFITELTGINNEMVSGKYINESSVCDFLKDVDLIVAHNAKFDRAFFETAFPNIEPKAWACSMFDINWNSEGVTSHKLEYIAYRYNFFYEGHRAITDCLAGLHVLSQTLHNSKQPVLKQLLNNSMNLTYKIWAKNAPYNYKDFLYSRKYRWSIHPEHGFKAWCIELPEHKVEDEISCLKSNIYNRKMNIPIDIFDAYSRFSVLNVNYRNGDYSSQLHWVKQLQKS